MNEEHDGTDQRKPSEEEYQRFRKIAWTFRCP